MIILTILLWILKILLWVVLGILGLILLVLLILLLVPVRYEIRGRKGGSESQTTDDAKSASLTYSAKVTWLAHLIGVNFRGQGKEMSLQLRIAFIKKNLMDRSSKEEERQEPTTEDAESDFEPTESLFEPVESAVDAEETAPEITTETVPELMIEADAEEEACHVQPLEVQPQTVNTTDEIKEEIPIFREEEPEIEIGKEKKTKKKKEKKPKKPKKQKKQKRESTVSTEGDAEKESGPDLLDRIDELIDLIWDLPDRIEEKVDAVTSGINEKLHKITDKIRGIYDEVMDYPDREYLLRKILKKIVLILKRLRPRKISGKLTYGFASPDVTGKVLGWYAMIRPKLIPRGKFVELEVTPDFDQKCLEGDIVIRGRIALWYIALPGLSLITDRKVWRLLKYIKKRRS